MKTCLTWLALYVALSCAMALCFLVAYPEAPPNTTPRLPPLAFRAAASLGAGFVCGIPAFLALAGFDGVRTRLRERRLVVAGSRAVEPRDGRIQPFVGRISGRNALTAPLTGRNCVMYHYSATHMSSKSRVTDAEGYALSPCSIDTAGGRFDVRAYLEPEFSGDAVDLDAARASLTAYQQTAALTQQGLDFAKNWAESKAQLLDDDGSIRYDHGFAGDLGHTTLFEEQVLQDGDEAAIFGRYSAERRAIVPDPQHAVLHMARLRKGSAADIARGFVLQAMLSGFVAVMFAAATVGLVGMFYTDWLRFN